LSGNREEPGRNIGEKRLRPLSGERKEPGRNEGGERIKRRGRFVWRRKKRRYGLCPGIDKCPEEIKGEETGKNKGEKRPEGIKGRRDRKE
jgi:hypothetical protein